MEPIKKLLFVTDLSEHAKRAYDYAVEIAGKFGAGIVVLHVLEGTTSVSEDAVVQLLGRGRVKELKNQAKEDAKEILIGKKRDGVIMKEALDCFCNEYNNECREPSGVSTDTIVITEGKVVDGIIDTCEKACCDMIVMGHSVRRVIDEPVFGRTTRGVLRRSTKPVLLVPPPK